MTLAGSSSMQVGYPSRGNWKSLLSGLIRLTLLPTVVRELVQRRKVTILLYHDPSARTFADHLAALKKRYNLISLHHFVRALLDGVLETLPPKSLVLTFDDGHRGNYALRSLLRDLPAPATIFLCSGLVGTNRQFWFRSVPDSEALKRVPDAERVAALLSVEEESRGPGVEPQTLSHEEISDLKEFVDFESHTVSHPILPYCRDAKAWTEIDGSKRQLEATFGLSVVALSYPNGDYTSREIKFASDAGYTCGLTVDLGFNSDRTHPYRLRRISIDDEDDVSTLVVKASGLWGLAKRFVAKPDHGYTDSPPIDG
jgi:peptidoglycan/xylan/chitin deacetylase (PgdA/CDA1 family)